MVVRSRAAAVRYGNGNGRRNNEYEFRNCRKAVAKAHNVEYARHVERRLFLRCGTVQCFGKSRFGDCNDSNYSLCHYLCAGACRKSVFLAYKGASNEKPVAIPRGIVVLFGILACISFLAEGAVMDWSGVFLTEAKGLDLSLAGIGYAIFP